MIMLYNNVVVLEINEENQGVIEHKHEDERINKGHPTRVETQTHL